LRCKDIPNIWFLQIFGDILAAIQEEKKRDPSNGSFNKKATAPPNCPKNRQSNKVTTEVKLYPVCENRD